MQNTVTSFVVWLATQEVWSYGSLYCCKYPLAQIDSIDETGCTSNDNENYNFYSYYSYAN